jgi:exopolysaccharide production protein ExoQ
VLSLCLAFIYILFRNDQGQNTGTSKALWIPLIWTLVEASKPLGAWLRVGSTDPQQGSPLDLAFQAVLILVALVVLGRRQFDWSSAMRENIWLMALIVFIVLSMLWSDFPLLTIKRVIKQLLAILMALVILSETRPHRALETILRRTTFVFIPLSPVLIKFFPEYGRLYTPWSGEEMWIGVAGHKNSLAALCIMSGLFLIWSLVRRWRGNNPAHWKYQTHTEILLLALSFWLLGGPDRRIFYSATSIYALVAGLLLYGGLNLAKRRKWRISSGVLMTLVLIIIIFGTLSAFTGGSKLGGFATATGRDSTLTGRTKVWNALVPVVMRNPVVGGGFGVFWTPERRDFYGFSGAHNGYLDVLLGLGFVGLVLVTVFLLSSCRKAHRELSRDFDWGALWLGYLIMSVVHNMGESSIDSFTIYLTAIILFFTVSSASIGQRAVE